MCSRPQGARTPPAPNLESCIPVRLTQGPGRTVHRPRARCSRASGPWLTERHSDAKAVAPARKPIAAPHGEPLTHQMARPDALPGEGPRRPIQRRQSGHRCTPYCTFSCEPLQVLPGVAAFTHTHPSHLPVVGFADCRETARAVDTAAAQSAMGARAVSPMPDPDAPGPPEEAADKVETLS